MEARKFVLQQTGIVALGQLICCGVMIGVFALLHRLDGSVWLGTAIGGVLATANFLFMAIFASLAADKATAQDVKGGQALMHRSYLIRYLVLFILLFAAAKSGLCNVFALVLPLLFVRPTISIGEFFRKKDDEAQ